MATLITGIENLDEKQKDSLKKILSVQGGGELKDEELEMVINFCRVTRLNPFAGQVWVQRRWVKKLNREVSTVQTKIDGLRAIAHNHGLCGIEPTQWHGKGADLKATVCVLKKLSNTPGDIAKFYGEAKYSEYVQKDRDGQVTQMWADRPELMLEKCAEAKALRRGFSVLSQVTAEDEPDDPPYAMEQAPPAREVPSRSYPSISQGDRNAQPSRQQIRQVAAEEIQHEEVEIESDSTTEPSPSDYDYGQMSNKELAGAYLKLYNKDFSPDNPLSYKKAMEKFFGIVINDRPMTDEEFKMLYDFLKNMTST